MDFILYEAQKYRLYKNMKKLHKKRFDLAKSTLRQSCGKFDIQKSRRDLTLVKKLIKKYHKKMKTIETSDYGSSIVDYCESILK